MHDRVEQATVGFTQMIDGTAADYALLDRYEREHAAGLADRLLSTLDRLRNSLGGYRVTRLEHSLQTATRARLDGADTDWVVAALLHDIGDELAPYHHAALAATILGPYVRAEVTWVIEHHGIFQEYHYAHHLGRDRNSRDRYAGHEWYRLCADFCERWDQASFDPDFSAHDLESFSDDVHAVFARPAWHPDVVAAGPPVLVAP